MPKKKKCYWWDIGFVLIGDWPEATRLDFMVSFHDVPDRRRGPQAGGPTIASEGGKGWMTADDILHILSPGGYYRAAIFRPSERRPGMEPVKIVREVKRRSPRALRNLFVLGYSVSLGSAGCTPLPTDFDKAARILGRKFRHHFKSELVPAA